MRIACNVMVPKIRVSFKNVLDSWIDMDLNTAYILARGTYHSALALTLVAKTVSARSNKNVNIFEIEHSH